MSDRTAPFATVQRFYAALSACDHDAMHDCATDDFRLLEGDRIWQMDEFIELAAQGGGIIQRSNFFALLGEQTGADMACVSYYNRAVYTMGTQFREMHWLESAVLRRVGDVWQLQLLHTGEAEVANMPQGTEFIEYVED